MRTQENIRFIDFALPGEVRVAGMSRKQIAGYGGYAETDKERLQPVACQTDACEQLSFFLI